MTLVLVGTWLLTTLALLAAQLHFSHGELVAERQRAAIPLLEDGVQRASSLLLGGDRTALARRLESWRRGAGVSTVELRGPGGAVLARLPGDAPSPTTDRDILRDLRGDGAPTILGGPLRSSLAGPGSTALGQLTLELPADAGLLARWRERLVQELAITAGLCVPLLVLLVALLRRAARRARTHEDRLSATTLDLEQEVGRRARTVERLRVSQERYELAARGASGGLWDWNLRTDELFYSPRWKTMLGYDEREIEPTLEAWLGLVHPEDRPEMERKLRRHVAGKVGLFEDIYRIRSRSGEYRWMLCRGLAIRDAGGRPLRVAGSQTDVTDMKRAEARLRREALHDPLTGLPNRSHFQKEIEVAIGRARLDDAYRFAVLFIDLDDFKVVNDSLGHEAGDQLLREVSSRLRRSVRVLPQEGRRTRDSVARLGGDEFAILLDGIESRAQVESIAHRIQERLRAPHLIGSSRISASASIGITLPAGAERSSQELLRDSDTAMYRAKARGRGFHEFFDKSMHLSAVQRMQVERDIEEGLEERQFELHYQPILDLTSGCFAGFEALVRWNHPTRGFIGPGEFIPIAEETGLIVPLGEWLLNEACRQLRAWALADPSRAGSFMGVNISTRQFELGDVAGMTERALRTTGLPPELLKVEITESVIMEGFDKTQEILERLRALGVQVAIDDFGTGYSSLSYLHQLPIDVVKIDRSFVGELEWDDQKRMIVNGICALVHGLGLDVVAEGVETPGQLEILRELGCRFGQGFLFSRPVPADQAEAFLFGQPSFENTSGP